MLVNVFKSHIIFSLFFGVLCKINDPYKLQHITHEESIIRAELDYIADSKFSYANTSEWNVKYPICGEGLNQSPIDIVLKNCANLPTTQAHLKITNEDYRPGRVEILNDHYTVKYFLTWQKGFHPKISIDNKNTYIPRDIHFHWGTNNTHGSEHVLNAKKYSMEMHIVCYNAKYKSVSNAKHHKDGIVVLAQFFHAKTSAPKYFFLDNLPQVKKTWSRVLVKNKLCHFNLGEFANVTAIQESFVMYSGSFTTPPCYEDVTWILGLNVNSIRSRDVNLFRNLVGPDGPIVDNCRPIQRNNFRKCYVKR